MVGISYRKYLAPPFGRPIRVARVNGVVCLSRLSRGNPALPPAANQRDTRDQVTVCLRLTRGSLVQH